MYQWATEVDLRVLVSIFLDLFLRNIWKERKKNTLFNKGTKTTECHKMGNKTNVWTKRLVESVEEPSSLRLRLRYSLFWGPGMHRADLSRAIPTGKHTMMLIKAKMWRGKWRDEQENLSRHILWVTSLIFQWLCYLSSHSFSFLTAEA